MDGKSDAAAAATGVIRYECEECRRELDAPDHFALLILFCQHCHAPTQIPAAPTGERWREIRGLNGNYEVSDFGRIRRVRGGRGAKLGKLLEPRIEAKTGHALVSLSRGAGTDRQFKVHKLVWQAFKAPVPPQMHVGHLNATRDAAGALDNHLANLQLLGGARA